MKQMTFFVRIFLCLMAVILVATAVPAYYFSHNMEKNIRKDLEAQAFEKLELMKLFFEVNGDVTSVKVPYIDIEKELEQLQLRLTLIDISGEVLYDSQVEDTMLKFLDNHADRMEIKSAIQTGKGVSSRFSNTLNTNFIYVAERLSNGDMLRIAYPQKNLLARIDSIQETLIYIFVFSMFFALIIAFTLSYNIKKQLKTMIDVVNAISLGKLGSRLHQVPGAEFSILASAVNRMAENIENQHDIMEHQSAQLNVIFNTMQDGILLLDSKGNIRHSNKAFRDIAPQIIASAKNTQGADAHDYNTDSMPECVNMQVIECISSPILQNAVEMILKESAANTEVDILNMLTKCDQALTQTGPLTYYIELELFSGRFFAVYLAKPENPTPAMGLVIVLHEITEMMRLENVRRDFVANVSHELRTPLTSIQGYAETLATMPELSNDSKRFAQIIYKHGTYLNNMIGDLLALARIENTQEECIFAPVDANEALQIATDFCEKAIQKNSLSLENSLQSDLQNTKIYANKEHIERVFRNLLENACRYALAQTPIKVFAKKEDTFCIFTIQNTGTLIPKDDIERIFERFYRVEKGRPTLPPISNVEEGNSSENTTNSQTNASTNGTATGLGLAICKHIIERHGGRIWAESIQEQDTDIAITAFHFTLKIVK